MKQFLLLVAVVATFGVAACENTVNGLGQDLERSGENIQANVPPK